MELHGIHHLTAVTANAPGNLAFYTRILGMRLVKKTVNQDDVSAYHLFYGDGIASPGSDITFFDFRTKPARHGVNSISRTALRVAGEESLLWWAQWFTEHQVPHGEIRPLGGRQTLDFEDPEGTRLRLVDDGGEGAAHPWAESPVPTAHQIRGLGPITLSVPDLVPTERVLTEVLNMRPAGAYTTPNVEGSTTHVFKMGPGGAAAELHVAVELNTPRMHPGAGGVHHVAFRMPDEAYMDWARRLETVRLPSSGPIDRFYFRSLYFREPNGILFELATDGPGFTADESVEELGTHLSLPPFLEHRRAEIEANLKPL
ncbi:ring-cleaving dioxygenase [Rhodoligotrophos defluvii]|uniref:ring-cleaving dioxygenase n=1 Tax=Rhodoligotrophos defluvii TaxID=2561934 RepID=UPI0010C9817D|nr:ring-cleaving dioxygenase [Rhodoligotrophos defluvii]